MSVIICARMAREHTIPAATVTSQPDDWASLSLRYDTDANHKKLTFATRSTPATEPPRAPWAFCR